MPAFEREAAELSHQIQFGGPDIAVVRAQQARLATGAEPEMIGDEMLPQQVIGIDADIVGIGAEDDGILAGRQLAQLRHAQLDHEAAAGLQMTGRIAEAGNLRGLCQQVRDRVIDEIDEREASRCPRRGHIADDDRDRRLIGLAAQLRNHRGRHFDARDLDAAGMQRHGDTAGPDGEFENAPAFREPGQIVHRRPQHVG